jgi:hypothetical protein
MTILDLFTLLASIATALGVFLAWWQIRLSGKQAVTAFEDTLSSQYRDLIQKLPVEALLGEDLDERFYREKLSEFYHYIDLTNEQIFLRQQGRVSSETWENWREGIKSMISRPAFSRAWEEISQKAPDSFNELRRLMKTDFAEDPNDWDSAPGFNKSCHCLPKDNYSNAPS